MAEVCQLILNDGEVDLNKIDGKAALFHAAKNNLPKVISALYDKILYHRGLPINYDLNTNDDEGKTAVFYANDNHSMDALCELIGDGAEFNLNEIDGKAVLFHSAKNDLSGVVKKLRLKGLNLDVTDDEGKTAVFYANENHSMDALCELIDCGAKYTLDEIDGKEVLFHAAKKNLPKVVSALHLKILNHGGPPINYDLNTTDDEGKTAVFYANKEHSMDALCELIGYGAEFNMNEIDGKAVLFHAANNNLTDVVRELCSKGLDLNKTDDEGKTAVFYANKNHSMDVLCELIEEGAGFNLDEIDGKAVRCYAFENHNFLASYSSRNVVRKLCFKGLVLDDTDDEGKTAVFYANKKHSMDTLCEMIRNGAKYNLNEIDGKAVLFHAANNNLKGIVSSLRFKILNHQGPPINYDLNTTDDEGKTAAFYANESCSMDTLCELIGYGAEFNLNEIDGKAVLFHSAKNDLVGVVDKLASKGLDLDITDDEGHTAVFYANKNQSMSALCELIGHGAEFTLDEIDGKNVFFYAAKNDFPEVVKPLYDAGIDLHMTDNEGKTAVFYANRDFLDALLAVDEVLINARNQYGRTPLFYALQDDTPTRAKCLIEKGANLQLRDSCNVSIYSFFIENCISDNEKPLQLFTSELFQEQQQLKALSLAILDIIYCQAPLLSVSGSPGLPKSYMILNQTKVLKAFAFARDQYLIQDADKIEDIDNIASMIRRNEIDVPRILSLLNKLGANPTAADSDGNTALHYATLLPLFGVTQEAVMDICKEVRKFGALFDVKNHQRQTPLQFCLSSDTWKFAAINNKWQSISGMKEVCRFLLSNGCSINETSPDGESVFHWIVVLIQQGLELDDENSRKAVLQVLIEVLKLLPPEEETVKNAVNKIDTRLNSPLHHWASIALKAPQEYTSRVTGDHTFEDILRIILDRLTECGAILNLRNANEETPLHLCKTWTAVKLLLDAEANPNVVDSSGRSPLLVAAEGKRSPKNLDCFYPDVAEDQEDFWRSALEKGLDPYTANEWGDSVLSILIKSEAFVLAKALVEVACKEKHVTNDKKLSFLNAICKDKLKHTHWKTTLVEVILKSTRKSLLSLDSPLRFCCRNIVQFGMFDEKPHSIQPKSKGEASNDDGQPPPKKRRKDGSAKKKKEKEESFEEQLTCDSVHCEIAKQLLSYGVDIHIPDSSGMSCLDIAEGYPSLKDLLTKPIEIDTIPILIPWTSVSDKYKGILAKVARGQECKMVDQIWQHRDKIGSGSFGLIFAGINEKDGREVAIKRVEKLRMSRPEDRRERENLTVLADCEQVVRYISFFEDADFSYVVLELMEGNLEEYLDRSTTDAARATLLCKDVVMGLKFLHKQKIIHRDLKPQNILYKVHPKLCLKISDFGLSRIIDSVSTTEYGTIAGTKCWIAPEVLASKTNEVDKNRFESASDMFSCGLIFHYIFSGKKHPFNPTDCAKRGELQVANKTEANIIKGKMKGWDDSLSPDATHLVKKMLDSNKGNRPSAEEALEHPFFWSNKKKMDFLKAVGNQTEFQCPRSKRTLPLTPVETDLQKNFSTIVRHGSWTSSEYKHMSDIYTRMTKGTGKKNFDTSSAIELVRFIQNVYESYEDNTFVTTVPIAQILFDDFVFLEYFPDLVMEVYKAVTTHGWDKARHDINCVMKRK